MKVTKVPCFYWTQKLHRLHHIRPLLIQLNPVRIFIRSDFKITPSFSQAFELEYALCRTHINQIFLSKTLHYTIRNVIVATWLNFEAVASNYWPWLSGPAYYRRDPYARQVCVVSDNYEHCVWIWILWSLVQVLSRHLTCFCNVGCLKIAISQLTIVMEQSHF